eukprot:NODE_10198_length_533_cov_42.982927_g9551_i0.p1 GENE.NODE_10198_length_533_cov_42.982927_g9551_i0~~NODE_10198_length_533_cov_42.982927_g9551_i0.p1  ORF type:complete len:105 (-),score=19.76 NODE_10198_length_533_cov_42.982927_g9551_i0:164-478(-)
MASPIHRHSHKAGKIIGGATGAYLGYETANYFGGGAIAEIAATGVGAWTGCKVGERIEDKLKNHHHNEESQIEYRERHQLDPKQKIAGLVQKIQEGYQQGKHRN